MNKAIIVTFGRFQPPTTGHTLLIERVLTEARNQNAEHSIHASQSQDPKKNPLPWKEKIQYMKKMFPKANISTDQEAKTIFVVLKKLDTIGYQDVTLIVGSDRVSEFKSQISKYIRHSDPRLSYNFTNFNVVSAGERDPDAEDVSGMSASPRQICFCRGDCSESQSVNSGGVDIRRLLLYRLWFRRNQHHRMSVQTGRSVECLLRKSQSQGRTGNLVHRIVPVCRFHFRIPTGLFQNLRKILHVEAMNYIRSTVVCETHHYQRS